MKEETFLVPIIFAHNMEEYVIQHSYVMQFFNFSSHMQYFDNVALQKWFKEKLNLKGKVSIATVDDSNYISASTYLEFTEEEDSIRFRLMFV